MYSFYSRGESDGIKIRILEVIHRRSHRIVAGKQFRRRERYAYSRRRDTRARNAISSLRSVRRSHRNCAPFVISFLPSLSIVIVSLKR